MSNPFLSAASKPGHGEIHLALLPPNTPRLKTIRYQYPLKLVSPSPVRTSAASAKTVHIVYLLTYGGGLVAGDAIDLHVGLDASTQIILLTQGSTKIFKSPNRSIISNQRMTVDVAAGAALCFLPDPVQPFERSCFEQRQIYRLNRPSAPDQALGSLCVLDWVCNGRPANGENWSFFQYESRNELYLRSEDEGADSERLMLRDSIRLADEGLDGSIAARMEGLAVFGTLILYGPLVQGLANFFMDEFKRLPRIGGRKWDSNSDTEEDEEADPSGVARSVRQRRETVDGLLWSAASVRGCVVVKFAAREVEGGRSWLRGMIMEEGSIPSAFGEQSLLCLR